MLIAGDLKKISGISHGFFGCNGGVSSGIYSSLNCRADENDSKENVAENKMRILEKLGCTGAKFQLLHQVHGSEVVVIDNIITPAPQADGLVTKRKNIALGILTADCAPILFADKNSGIVGCCHAGWRGAKAGIAEKTLQAMESLGAERKNITAVIGPCIGPNSYEVDEKFMDGFIAERPRNSDYFKAGRPGHFFFSLPDYILDGLKSLSIGSASWTGHDTLPEQSGYFSYRRNTLAGIKNYGCQVSVIVRI